jgi:hypothetical protein
LAVQCDLKLAALARIGSVGSGGAYLVSKTAIADAALVRRGQRVTPWLKSAALRDAAQKRSQSTHKRLFCYSDCRKGGPMLFSRIVPGAAFFAAFLAAATVSGTVSAFEFDHVGGKNADGSAQYQDPGAQLFSTPSTGTQSVDQGVSNDYGYSASRSTSGTGWSMIEERGGSNRAFGAPSYIRQRP